MITVERLSSQFREMIATHEIIPLFHIVAIRLERRIRSYSVALVRIPTRSRWTDFDTGPYQFRFTRFTDFLSNLLRLIIGGNGKQIRSSR